MNDSLMTGVVSIALGILGVATLAVIFSNQANTSNVIQAGGSALANNILAAVSPINGNAPQGNFTYPSSFR